MTPRYLYVGTNFNFSLFIFIFRFLTGIDFDLIEDENNISFVFDSLIVNLFFEVQLVVDVRGREEIVVDVRK